MDCGENADKQNNLMLLVRAVLETYTNFIIPNSCRKSRNNRLCSLLCIDEKLKTVSILDAIMWLSEAWDEVPETAIANYWIALSPSEENMDVCIVYVLHYRI